MKKQSFWKLGAIGMTAISGIEIALWDIRARRSTWPSGACSAAKFVTRSGFIRISAWATCTPCTKPNDEGPLVGERWKCSQRDIGLSKQ